MWDLIDMEKYSNKKLKNQELLPKIKKHVTERTLGRIETCANVLEFIADEKETKRKMIGGLTCKNRFCPVCSWRKAKKDAMMIATLMRYIQAEHDKSFIFLTLTVPNVSGDVLKDEIKTMNLAFKKLFKRKEVMAISHGYMRKLEITYNSKRNDFHPHFHAVLAVNKSYGKKKGYYITRDEWLQLWRDCKGDQSITQVDIRRMDMQKGVNEIAKYSAKDADYLHSEAVFDYFYKALKGAQVFTFNGLFKDAVAKYKAGDLEDYKQIDETEYIWKIVSSWFPIYRDADGIITENQYQDIVTRSLTEEEKDQYNFKAMGESEEFSDD